MPNVIVRNIPEDDVAVLKRAATRAGLSLQAMLEQELRDEAARHRRREALARMRDHLTGRSTVSVKDVVDSMNQMRTQRVTRATETTT